MTKTEAMQNALGTICVAEIENDIEHYKFDRWSNCYMLGMFTGNDIETAERVLEKFRHGFVDGTSMEVIEIEDTYCVNVTWEWQ